MDRQQMVKFKECVGEPFQTKYGIPRWSVFEPLLFTLYTTPLSKIISRYNVCHHLYADDTQIYITLSESGPEMSLALLQDCLLDVGDWMRSSKLKLNPEKTEVLLFGIKLHRKEFIKHFPEKNIGSRNNTNRLEIMESCLTAVWISENTYHWFVVLATITFVTYVACVGVWHRKSLKPLQHRSFQVNWTIAIVSSMMLQTEN